MKQRTIVYSDGSKVITNRVRLWVRFLRFIGLACLCISASASTVEMGTDRPVRTNGTPFVVSATALPLPTGAASEATLAAINARIDTGSPLIVTPSTATLKSAVISISATGTIVAAVAGKRIKVYALSYISGGAASINFRDGASTAIEGAYAHVANSGRVENVNPPAFLFATSAGNSLDMTYSGAGTVGGRISYWEE